MNMNIHINIYICNAKKAVSFMLSRTPCMTTMIYSYMNLKYINLK